MTYRSTTTEAVTGAIAVLQTYTRAIEQAVRGNLDEAYVLHDLAGEHLERLAPTTLGLVMPMRRPDSDA